MLDVSERLREFVDGAEIPVTMSDIEAVLADRPRRPAMRSKQRHWWTTPGVLTATAVLVVVVIVSIVAVPSPPPVKIRIPASTPIALDVPSTPKLAIKLPNYAIEKHRINWAKVPSYIPLFLGTSLIGYVQKSSVEHPPLIAAPKINQVPPPSGQSVRPTCVLVSPNSPEVVKVFSKTRVLVGWIFPTAGFVRVGNGQTCGP
jgi:hypothetical protein